MSSFLQAAQPKGKYIKFDTVGTEYTLEVQSYTKRQATDYTTKAPKFYPNSGDPILEEHISCLDYGAQSADDAQVVLVVNKQLMRQRIGEALEKAGAGDLEQGGILTISYKGDGPKKPNAASPPKDFAVSYTLPEPQDNPWGGAAE